MKKSKLVAIGLLALSIASCHRHREKRRPDWNDYNTNPNYYIDNGNGYYTHGGISPFWIWYAYHLGASGSVYSSPGVVYRSYSGGYVSSYGGLRTSIARSSVSRGGFGFSGSHASS